MQFDRFCGRRVLVTGHTGFKGSWLCSWLARVGAQVSGLSLEPERDRPNLFKAMGLEHRLEASLIGDISDVGTVQAAVEKCRPEIIFHLAAQALVRRSYRRPVETFASNVMGTLHVLEVARNSPDVRAIVCVTTDKVYENLEWPWGYREVDRLGGKDPYSASKACAELVAQSYLQTMFPMGERPVALATARGGNVVGGGDWSEDRLVPDVVRSLNTGEPIVLRNPTAVRPWQHVLELVRAYLMLGQRLLATEDVQGAWNFGPERGNEVNVETVVRSFHAMWGDNTSRIEVVPSALKEAHFLKLDTAKAAQALDWQPVLDFTATMRLTADWYRRFHRDGADARRLVDTQIEDYVARL